MKLIDLRKHFIEKAGWLDPDPYKTVDKIIAGDPEQDIQTCVVAWTSSFEAVRQAVARGVDLLVTHEATYYRHSHHSELEYQTDTGYGAEKRRFIEDNGLAILRLHDTWDYWPEVGITFSWAKFLGLPGRPVAMERGQHRYDIEPTTLGEFVEHVASKTAAVGEPHPIAFGDLDHAVSKIGVGVGCGCNIDVFRGLGCDLSVVCDDGSCYWAGIQRAEDEGHPVIRVNHGTSEEAGMKNLAKYINENIEGVTAEYLPVARKFHQV